MRKRARTNIILTCLAAVVLGSSWPTVHVRAGDQQASQESTLSAADKAALARAKRRCFAQCDSENGQCNSEVRQSRQVCSKEASTGGNNPFSGRAEAYDYYCGYFDVAQCSTRGCVQRLGQRYAQCVQLMRGDITARRFDCMRAEGKAQSLCRAELRDCRAQCQ